MTTRNVFLIGIIFAASAAAGFSFFEATKKESVPLQENTATASQGNSDTLAMRPIFALNDIDGNERSITEWDGKALVINFWATWCAPCRREIPLLIEMQNELIDKNVQFIGIAIDDPVAVSRYAEQTAFNYPILVGEQDGIDAAEAFGADVVALPMTVFTDQAGRVVEIHAGEIKRQEIEAILKTLSR